MDGGFSKTVLFLWENADEFDALHHSLQDKWKPSGALEEDAVYTILTCLCKRSVAILGGVRMFDVRRLATMAAMLFGLGSLLPIQADAIELTGAWATQADLCNLVFTKKGNQVMFAELSDLYGSGFIIDGNKIKGKAAQCTIKSRKQEGDGLELSAACATSIMTSSVRFSLKVIDDNNLSRIIPEMPGMRIKYTRCAL